MQTNFAPERLADPDIAVANRILRTCVHCGFCTATCPTFVTLGDELDSPRGRIYLIKDMLESGGPPAPEIVPHLDRCLSCLSCMTTCPSGVDYMHLIDYARRYVEAHHRRPWPERLLRSLLAALLPYPGRFRTALRLARLARPLASVLEGFGALGKRLAAMLRLTPPTLPPPSPLEARTLHPAEGTRRMRVALLTGCAQRVLDPAINEATIRLLTRLGCEVVIPEGAGCCGALPHHMGKEEEALALARANLEAWGRELDGAGLDAVVINASGCGTTVKDYGFLFRLAPEPLKSRAERIARLACDVTELLARLDYAPRRTLPPLTVAYHAACSLQHGQRITDLPKALLRKAGFTVREPREAHLCCGSAGTYNLLQPEISAKLRARKLGRLGETGGEVIATGNIGCLTQLSGGELPVVHTIELLDWAHGGPAPEALAARARVHA
jgi:glycolate oxidase iron-sulfur subunit